MLSNFKKKSNLKPKGDLKKIAKMKKYLHAILHVSLNTWQLEMSPQYYKKMH